MTIYQFGRLQLPNGQIARSLWHEKKHPDHKIRVVRNVKVSKVCTSSEYQTNEIIDDYQW